MNRNSLVRTPASPLTVVRWIARLGGLLFCVATVVTDAVVIAEMVGGNGPSWASLSATEWANVALALALPLVTIAGVAIAWLWKGTGEGLGGGLIVGAALVAMLSSLVGPSGGGLSMAASSLPMALVGAGFLYCWWVTRHTQSQPAGQGV